MLSEQNFDRCLCVQTVITTDTDAMTILTVSTDTCWLWSQDVSKNDVTSTVYLKHSKGDRKWFIQNLALLVPMLAKKSDLIP